MGQIAFDAHFWGALVSIIGINLVLAGDNAIVIAMAAHSLPARLQRRAIVLGTIAAVVLRIALTIGIVVLLDVPLLKVVGGLMLFWIAFKLGADEGSSHTEQESGERGLIGAITTILVADVVMSIDNVLAVAAVADRGADGSRYLLISLGLIISIPIVMGGATILLRLIERFPVLVWIGVALIAYTGMELALSDAWMHAHVIRGSWLDHASLQRIVSIGAAIVVVTASVVASRRNLRHSHLKVD